MIEASVREWHDELGWGVVDATETPGGCWVHFSNIDADGYLSLTGVETVLLDYERVEQDGYQYRAIRVVVRGREPARRTEHGPSGAYRSGISVEWDE